MVIQRGMLGLSARPPKKTKGKTVSGGKRLSSSSAAGQTWLKLSVNTHREDKRKLWDPPKTDWHPSSLGEVCDRKSLLKMMGYRGDPVSQKLSRIFDMGKIIEKLWQDDFQKMGILLSKNVRLLDPGPPSINGEYDVMIRHPFEPTRKLLGEIKSINDRGFKALPPLTLDPETNYRGIMETTGDIGARIRGYMVQFQNYLRLTKMEEGFILFDNKNTQEYSDYLLGYHPELMDECQARMMRLDPYRPAMIIPPCTCKGQHKSLCLYRTQEEVPLVEMQKFSEDAII